MYPLQNPDTPTRTVREQAIVITPEDSVLHTLNPTGTFIWELCDGTRSVAEIAQACAIAFDVSEAVAEGETAGFVERASARGLIHVLETPVVKDPASNAPSAEAGKGPKT